MADAKGIMKFSFTCSCFNFPKNCTCSICIRHPSLKGTTYHTVLNFVLNLEKFQFTSDTTHHQCDVAITVALSVEQLVPPGFPKVISVSTEYESLPYQPFHNDCLVDTVTDIPGCGKTQKIFQFEDDFIAAVTDAKYVW